MPVDPRFYAPYGAKTLADWADRTGAELRGDPGKPAFSVGSAERAGEGDVCFHEGKPEGAAGVSPLAAGCFIREDAAEHLPKTVAALISPRPRLDHVRASRELVRVRVIGRQESFVHPDANVHKDAELAPGVTVGAGAAIGARTLVGAGSVIGPGVQVGRDCDIGHHVSIICALIGDHVRISSGARVGEAGFGVVASPEGAVDQPHFGRVILQDRVSIGANTTIDRGAFEDTVIGERTKIDNLCQIAHNVQIGRSAMIAAYGGISGSVVIGDGARLGGRVGIADHVTIGNGSSLAASSGVFRDIPDGETWGGTPARPNRQYMRELAWLQKQVRERNRKS